MKDPNLRLLRAMTEEMKYLFTVVAVFAMAPNQTSVNPVIVICTVPR